MKNKIDYIIARILSGEASSEDILSLSSWLNEDEKNRKEFSILKSYWDAEISYNHFSEPTFSLHQLEQKITRKEKESKRRQFIRLWGSVVAIGLLLFTIGFSLIRRPENHPIEQHYTYLTTDNRTEFTLSDGTKIKLNKNSKLIYSDSYGKQTRDVRLEGEAYFEVASDTVKPFVVIVADDRMRVKVLGTRFNVNAYPNEANVYTTLVEGSVVLQFTEKSLNKIEQHLDQFHTEAVFSKSKNKVIEQRRMIPNEKVTYHLYTRKLTVQKSEPDDDLAWKDGLIKYKKIAFADLIKDMEKMFNVSIRIQTKELTLSSETVSGSFSEDQSLEQILEVVSRSLPIQWTVRNNVYYIE